MEGKTVAANIQKYGTGALHIDASRLHGVDAQGVTCTVKRLKPGATLNKTGGNWRPEDRNAEIHHGELKAGRFPSNLILDEYMAGEMDRESGEIASGKPTGQRKAPNKIYGQYATGQDITGYGNTGGASRFCYVAKSDAEERGPGNNHPTVKPLALLHYLIRLICPIEPGRIIMEPFAGSGTTCISARQLGLDFIAYEIQLEYIQIAEKRLKDMLGLFH
jgi:hypothetical protein